MLRRVLSMAAHAVAFERAIVTGAGSGIGRATAAALCAGKKWDGAAAPAVAVGTIGYALATFLGLATARVLS